MIGNQQYVENVINMVITLKYVEIIKAKRTNITNTELNGAGAKVDITKYKSNREEKRELSQIST